MVETGSDFLSGDLISASLNALPQKSRRIVLGKARENVRLANWKTKQRRFNKRLMKLIDRLMERRSELNSSRKLLDEAQQVTEKVQAEVSQGRKSSESASAQLRKVEEEKNEYQEQLRKNLITA